MADYNNLMTQLVGNPEFQDRVKLAGNAKAKAIALEPEDGLEVSARKRYAAAFIRNPDDQVNELTFFIALDSAITAKPNITNHLTDVSDAEIDAALSDALWDKLAEALS